MLAPAAKKFLTVNTHKTLFQPTCLQFRVHSASSNFQYEMENRLLKVLFVKVESDDVLISGKNYFDHFQNLKAVLDILKENGLRLKMN